MPGGRPRPPRHRLLPLGRRQVRQALGVFWIAAAVLSARPPGFTASWWHLQAGQSAMGEPSPIRESILWAVGVIGAHAGVLNALLVASQLAIGVALVAGRFERPAIIASVPLALGIWWVGEAFGMLASGFATMPGGAPGPVLLYPVVALLAWPRPGADGAWLDRGKVAATWISLWTGQAVLLVPWRFGPGQVFGATVAETSGGPSWIAGPVNRAGIFLAHHGAPAALALAVLSALVGLAVVVPAARVAGLGVGLVLLVAYWFEFQGAGALLVGQATDVGAAPLVALLALSMPAATWPRPALVARAWTAAIRPRSVHISRRWRSGEGRSRIPGAISPIWPAR
jgi:hypothetical protein